MSYTFRCNCPFTSAIDIIGDKWMLVIVKQMLIEGKETFKDFIECEEAIATNILTTKLKLLEEFGILTKKKHPNNKKTNLYHLTEMGLSLTPVLIELAIWSDKELRTIHPILNDGEGLKQIRADKNSFIEAVANNYRQKYYSTSE